MREQKLLRIRPAAVAWLLLCLSGPALADIVYLKNGNRVEGEVQPGSKPGTIKVTVDRGHEIEFDEKDVRELERKKAPAKEFDERFASLARDDVDGILALAEWARERKLRSKEEQAYRKALEIDPNDPVARKELGFAVFKNSWVKEADLRAKHGLIQFRGDWVTPEEKERRVIEELRKEIADLLRGVDSENSYIREYSVQKLLQYRDPRAKTVLLGFLADPRETVRIVSASAFAALAESSAIAPPEGSGPGAKKKKAAAAAPSLPAGEPSPDGVARAFFDRILKEESPFVRTALSDAVRKLRSRPFFELALEAMGRSENPLHRDRAAEGVLAVLRKAWVGEVIDSLATRPPGVGPREEGNPAVRSLLEKVFGVDLGYAIPAWKNWWARNQAPFRED